MRRMMLVPEISVRLALPNARHLTCSILRQLKVETESVQRYVALQGSQMQIFLGIEVARYPSAYCPKKDLHQTG